jgi:hypothetical protein
LPLRGRAGHAATSASRARLGRLELRASDSGARSFAPPHSGSRARRPDAPRALWPPRPPRFGGASPPHPRRRLPRIVASRLG